MKTYDDIEEQDKEARSSLGGMDPNKWEDAAINFMVAERARQSEHADLMTVLDRIAEALEMK